MRYYDTSAIVKRYVFESGSADLVPLIDGDAPAVTGAASGAEVCAAIAKAVRVGRLDEQVGYHALSDFIADWAKGYTVISVDGVLAERAGRLAWTLGLRGYDAVHLAAGMAAAEVAADALTIVTYDREMYRAARKLGLGTYPEDLDAFYATLSA